MFVIKIQGIYLKLGFYKKGKNKIVQQITKVKHPDHATTFNTRLEACHVLEKLQVPYAKIISLDKII